MGSSFHTVFERVTTSRFSPSESALNEQEAVSLAARGRFSRSEKPCCKKKKDLPCVMQILLIAILLAL